MPSYDAERFDPPAPLATVSLRDPRSGATLAVLEMLIDSGADVTVVPQSAIDQLGVQAIGGAAVELSGFDGERSIAPSVALEMRFMGRLFRGQFVVLDLPSGILGRNVLNNVQLLLDGPRLKWEVSPPASQPSR